MKSMKYSTSRKWASVNLVLIMLIILIIAQKIFQAGSNLIILIVLAFFVFVIIDSFVGMYVKINDKKICRVNSFVLKRCIDLSSIQSIRYSRTFNLGKSFAKHYRSLYIVGVSQRNNPVNIRLSNDAYTEQTLAQIANTLKTLNSHIDLDENTKTLILKYKKQSGSNEN